MAVDVEVDVEYCGKWGYAPRFQELQRKILEAVPEATVRGAVGRQSSFEITINDVEVFSKLQMGSFPNFIEVVEVVKAARDGHDIEKVKSTESCSVM